ncbi:MAG TPA: PilZ domain-containing protein [Myxococcales bacterium]|jgi:uncharacterized protein (TIGR02266 family)|nr:PilZ domain-containing protein [Myxococcales bacterium]
MNGPKRRFVRRSLQVEFRGTDAEGAGVLLFETADLSAGGTFLKSDLLLEEGETLSFEFRVPGSDRPLVAQARIAWVRRFPSEGQPAGMGVEFMAMSDEDRGALARFLA